MFKERFQPEINLFANSNLFTNYKTIQELIRPEEYDYSDEQKLKYVESIKEDKTNDELIDLYN